MTQRWRKLGVIFPQRDAFPHRDADVWSQRPSAPCVFRTEDRYLMYLHGLQFFSERRKLTRIGLAEAPLDDPLDWRMVSEEPLIDLGGEGATDSHMAAYPWVVRITDTHWHLYYAAWDGSFVPHAPHQKRYQTCMAESDDAGVTWRRDGRPLLELGRSGAPDENGTGSCAVIPVGNEYWMYYTALSVPTADWGRISTALAVSRDGGHTFVPHAAGALLNLPPRIGHLVSTCSKPFVERSGDLFHMWFSCAVDGEHYRIHYAESADGIHFKWLPDAVVDVSESGWDSQMTCYPSVIRHQGPDGTRTLMFYAGNDYAGIGAAELCHR